MQCPTFTNVYWDLNIKNSCRPRGRPETGGPMPWHNWHTSKSGPGARFSKNLMTNLGKTYEKVYTDYRARHIDYRVSQTCGLRFRQQNWRTEMTFTSTWRCCGVFVTPVPHIKLFACLLTYLLTYLSVVDGLGWVHCVGVVGRVGLGL